MDREATPVDGVLGDGPKTPLLVDHHEDWDRDAVDGNREEDKPHVYRANSSHEDGLFLVAFTNRWEQVYADVLKVEDGADADGAEVAHKKGIFPVLGDARHNLVQEHDGRNPVQCKNHEPQADETRVRDASELRLVELVPGHDGSDVYECPDVKEEVRSRVKLVVLSLRLFEVFAVPSSELCRQRSKLGDH